MNWNNPQLDAIQQMEYQLLDNPKDKTLFTNLIHTTSKWIDSKNAKEVLDYKPIEMYVVPEYSGYKFYEIKPDQMDAIINNIAKFIELGSNLNVACTLAGYSYNVLRPKFTVQHKAKFKIARELKYKLNN